MKRFIKIFIALIAILLIAIIGFAITFNPNDYKDDIITVVKEQTGRDLAIPGNISLSLFPWIGIDLGAIEISNAKGFGRQPFAKMTHLQIRAKLWPLLTQKLEADTLVIEGLSLNLSKNKKGINNWDDLLKNQAQTKKTESTPTKHADKKILAAFALNGITIKNAQFDWHDKQLGQKVLIKNIQLSLGQLKPESKIPVDISFQLKEKSLDARIKFNSDIVFSSDMKRFSFHGTQFSSDLNLIALKKHLSPKISSTLMELNLDKQTFNTEALALSAGTVTLQTKMSAKKLFTSPDIDGQLTLNTFNPRKLAKDIAMTLPAMSDNTALTKLNARVHVTGSVNNLNLSDIKLTLDDTNLTGNAKIKATTGFSTINLNIDSINLDRYLPKPVAAKQDIASSKNNNSGELALIPVALLSKINTDSNIKIKKIQVKNTHWTDFNVVAHSKNGNIKIKPLTLSGYDATIQSNFTIKALKNNAALSGNLNVTKIKAGKLINDYLAKDKFKGQTSLVANFTTSGIKLSQLKQNLNGKLKLDMQDVTIKGFDLQHQQKVLNAKLKGHPAPAAPKPEETKIAKLTASAIIKKGILNNNDLRASTPLSRIAGKGTVNIAKEKLNYVTTVKFTSSTDLKSTTTFEKMNTLPLDILITGTFDKPSIKPDFQKVIDELIKRKIKKEKTKIKEKVKEDLKKELQKKLGDELKNLLKF